MTLIEYFDLDKLSNMPKPGKHVKALIFCERCQSTHSLKWGEFKNSLLLQPQSLQQIIDNYAWKYCGVVTSGDYTCKDVESIASAFEEIKKKYRGQQESPEYKQVLLELIIWIKKIDSTAWLQTKKHSQYLAQQIALWIKAAPEKMLERHILTLCEEKQWDAFQDIDAIQEKILTNQE